MSNFPLGHREEMLCKNIKGKKNWIFFKWLYLTVKEAKPIARWRRKATGLKLDSRAADNNDLNYAAGFLF
jgi:hypothetical protein